MNIQSQSGISQRGLLSISMLLFSIGGLTIAMLAGTKMIFDIFDVGLMESLDGLVIKVIVIALAYLVGWATAILAIRVYGNLVLPFIINIYIWVTLVGICTLYLLILQRLYNQEYDFFRFIAYAAIMASAGIAMIGLHLILEGHTLRPLAIPLMIINLIQLGLIVFRYVFTPDVKSAYLIFDLIFFIGMTAFSVFMLAHIGLLRPIRRTIAYTFDRNSRAIRSEE